ncbi:MAG: hypothetical protein H6732_05890 [Alphaproteobacteria bacterium]|nr:hypothetical protein [Alphaproteobacteria bacterium]
MRHLVLALGMLLAPTAHAATDGFVCFQGLTGTCPDGANEITFANGWLPLAAWQVGVARPRPEAGSGQPEVAVLRPTELVLAPQTGTVPIIQQALAGLPVGRVVLALRRSGGVKLQAPYVQVDLFDAILQTSQLQSGGDTSSWRLTVAPDRVEFRTWRTDSIGNRVEPPVLGTWGVSP